MGQEQGPVRRLDAGRQRQQLEQRRFVEPQVRWQHARERLQSGRVLPQGQVLLPAGASAI